MLDDKLIKKPYSKTEYTAEAIRELRACMDPVTGPEYFCENFVYIRHPKRGRIKFHLYDYQRDLCKVYHNHRYSVALVSRQMGKTTLAAAYLLWYAMFKPDSTILIAAHKFSGAQEIMQYIRFAYENIPDHIRAGATSYNKGSIEFDNGSRIVAQATTENTGRGMAISCLRTDTSEVTVRDKETGEIRTTSIRDLVGSTFQIDSSVILKENSTCQVLTTDGFKDFEGITVVVRDCVRLTLTGHEIECTPDHEFWSMTHQCWKQCQHLESGESVRTLDGADTVVSIEPIGQHEVSDLVNVADTHSFIANGIDAHNCVYLDEFAFLRPTIAREFWTSISPTLSTGGKCIVTSTPNVDDDQFADIWFGSQKTIDEHGNETELGVNGFKGFKTTWQANPDRDEEWARAEEAKIGTDRFRREHLCEFVAFSETLISGQKLLDLKGVNPITKTGEIRWYEPIRKDGIYVVSLDPSMGTGGDFSAIQVLELPAMRQVAEWRHNRSRVEQQVRVLKQMLDHIAETADPENIYWSLENNGVGEAVLTVIRELDEETFPGTFMHDRRARNRRKGYATTHRTKLDACAKLKLLVENDRIKISSKSLIHELKYFIARGNSYEAAQGETDDLVMSLLVNIRMAQDIAAWEDRVTNALESNLHDAFAEDEIAPLPVMV